MHLRSMKHFRLTLIAGLILPLMLGVSSCRLLSNGLDSLVEEASAQQKAQQKAYDALNREDYKAALKLFQIAIQETQKGQELAQLYNGLGTAHNKLDQITEAIAAYQKSVELDPKVPQIWVNLGVVYRLAGDYNKALSAYEKALALDSNLATAHSSIGSLYVLQGKPKLAIDAFKKAIAIDANLSITHGNLALAYAMAGDFKDAETSLNRAVALGYENGKLVQERIKELKKLN